MCCLNLQAPPWPALRSADRLFSACFIFFPFRSQELLVGYHWSPLTLKFCLMLELPGTGNRTEPMLSLACPTPGSRSPQTGLFQSLLSSPSLP